MKYLSMNKEELSEIFVRELLPTNRSFEFYVNWENIDSYKEFNIELNAMNCLVRTENFDVVFKELLKKLPTVISTFPLLFGLSKKEREETINGKNELIVVNEAIGENDYLEYNFDYSRLEKGLSEKEIEKMLIFVEKMGVKKLLTNLLEKSLIDYVIGVLVGLDSNGRKNRGGQAFEIACEPIIKLLCEKYEIELYSQKQFKTLEKKGIKVTEDIKNRKADFILFKDGKVLNIEVNFFNDSGSKPEEIIDSYINRQSDLKVNDFEFALITDGKKCWKNSDKSQLAKGFRNINYLMNFNLAKLGMLEEIICSIFS